VKCFERYVSKVEFSGQRIRNSVGKRIVEIHIQGDAQTTETEALEAGVSFCGPSVAA
jgi:hypothetical protein